MKALPEALQQLIQALNQLPGIGKKTATRLAFHILKSDREQALALARAIHRVKSEIRQCSICFNITESDPCPICRDPLRDTSLICVVESPEDILLIERTNEFKGLYHVLGGVLSPLDGIGPEDLKIKELLNRLTPTVKEVILALNPSTEGEATAIYLAKLIKPLNIKISRLARGVPLGSSLEFVDELTLSRALQSRDEL